MKKDKFMEILAKRVDLSRKKTELCVKHAFDLLVEVLSEEKSHTVTGFGVFKVVQRAERKAFNPQTGKAMTIPSKKALKFKVSKNLKDKIAKL